MTGRLATVLEAAVDEGLLTSVVALDGVVHSEGFLRLGGREPPFTPSGSDERQYCSPGFNFPVGLIMRTMYGRYKEYHTSLDNKNLISFQAMKESIDMYYDVIKTIDENKCYKASVQFGTPQFSKSQITLYPSTMSSNKYNPHGDELRMILEMINLSDGDHDLLTIAEKRNLKMLDLLSIKKRLLESGYLTECEKNKI